MRRTCLACWLTLASLIVFSHLPANGAEQDSDPPLNFVLILVDDLGWSDLGCYGATYYESPNIDRLAGEGMRFTDAYAAAAVCSPTRAALITGRYPARIGITDWMRQAPQKHPTPADAFPDDAYEDVGEKLITPKNPFWMDLEEETLAELLQRAGYATAHIGKWHLGAQPWYPDKQGFTFHRGGSDLGQPPHYFFPYSQSPTKLLSGLEKGKDGEYLTDREAEEAVRFIRKNKDNPFFLYLAHYAVHTPIQAKPELTRKYKAKEASDQNNAAYAAMIDSVDQSVGKVLKELDSLGLSDQTVILLTSDNGGLASVTNNAPLRAGKGTPYEGGIRVPLIVRLPDVVQAGSESNVPVSSIDIFPTVLDIAGIPLFDDPMIDGKSLLGILEGDEELGREAIYWHFPHYRGGDATPYGIVRSGNHKLIRFYEDGQLELYDLKEDLGEEHNLAESMPDRAKQLDMMLSKWLLGVNAKLPKSKPNKPPVEPDSP